MAILYNEMEGSPTESYGLSEMTAQRRFKVAWSDRQTFVRELLGSAYPYLSAAKCVRAAASPMGGETGASETAASYDWAIVIADYSTDAPVDNRTESLEPSAEFITLPAGNFRWGAPDGDEVTDDEAPGKLLRKLDYVITRYNVTTIPPEVLSLVGYVNNANISPVTSGISSWVFAPETLLYTPPTATRTIDSTGASKWTITMRFSYQPWTWNKYWRSDTQAWTELYVAGGGVYKNYPLGALGRLL